MNVFEANRKTRENFLKVIDGLTTEQLNKIPEGFSNNIIWNLGHLLATQQILSYGLSDSEVILSENIIEEFRKGTKPENTYDDQDIEELKSIFIQVINETEEDYNFEVLDSSKFKEYSTSYGVVLTSLEDALEFNNVHEGLHLGIVMAMKKLV